MAARIRTIVRAKNTACAYDDGMVHYFPRTMVNKSLILRVNLEHLEEMNFKIFFNHGKEITYI